MTLKMMKKIYVIMLLGLLIGAGAQAQNAENLKRIESARIGLITERLGLSPGQAEQFWPLYKEFSQQRMAIRQDFTEAKRKHDPGSASEEENKRMLSLGMEVKERELSLEKTYADRLLQVIDSRQLVQLRRAEDDFRKMILRKIQERQQMDRVRQRNNDRLNQQRN
jgi:hypothetical protein